MRYRLGKKLGEASFREYLKRRSFNLTSLAEQIGYTVNGFYHILDGKTKRLDRERMIKLAELTSTSIGFDKEGVYFIDVAEEEDVSTHESLNIPDNLTPAKIKKLNRILALTEDWGVQEWKFLEDFAEFIEQKTNKH